MPSALLLIAFVAQAGQQVPATATLEGMVHTVRGRARVALPFASVELSGGGGSRVVVSADDRGRFRFTDLPSGPRTLTVTHVGYRTSQIEVVVPEAGLRIDVQLDPDPVPMPEVLVRGEREPVPTSGSAEQPLIDPEVSTRLLAQGTGMASSGLLDVLRALPGEEPPDGTEVLFMRGAALDLKSVLLDGAPVFTPFHVGGLIPSFDEWLMGRSDLWVGAAPAEYDGGLDYVLDLRTRSPARDRAHGSASVDLMGARGAWSAPLGGSAGILLGGRTLYDGLGRLLRRGASPYGYADGLARLNLDLGKGALRATGFRNRETVELDYGAFGAAADPLPTRAEWGNTAGSAELSIPWEGGRWSLLAAQGRYDAGLPLAGSLPAYASGHTTRREVNTNLDLPWGSGGALRLGLGLQSLRADYSARALAADGSALLFNSRTRATIGDAHGTFRLPLGTAGSLGLGVRASYGADFGVRLAPRVGFAWLVSDEAALSISVGRYHQLVTTADQDLPGTLTAAIEDGRTATPSLGRPSRFTMASANHLIVSLDQWLGRGVRLGLDGFYKRFGGLLADPAATLSSSGGDLRVRRSGGRVETWAGYSLSWHWSEGDRASSQRFVGRQLLSLGVRGALTGWSGLDVRLSYGDGLPLTAVRGLQGEDLDTPGSELGLSVPDPTEVAVGAARQDPPLTGGVSGDFLRLDAELYGEFETLVRGRSHAVRPYLKILNALDRRDALFYYFERWRGGQPRPLAELSILPVFGLEWHF